MLCPEIAQNVQLKVLPSDVLAKETKQIYYDMGNFDNVFTKKYRRWYKEGSKDAAVAKERVDKAAVATKEKVKDTSQKTKAKYNKVKANIQEKREERALKKQLEVKAEPVISKPVETTKPQENNIHNINFKKYTDEDQSLYTPVNIQKPKKNNIYGDFDNTRPALRDYN